MKTSHQATADFPTPFVAIDWPQCQANIADMQAFADQQHVKLRPHIKAHKLPKIALEQIKAGALGITASKIDEVEVMQKAGLDDILLAYPVVSTAKIQKFLALARKGRVSTIVDCYEAAQALNAAAEAHGQTIDVFIKIDSGLHRLGVLPEHALAFAQKITTLPALNLKGILTHAGHVYGASSPKKVMEIGYLEGTIMVECAEELQEAGIPIAEVSIGSTPTVKLGGKVLGVTEIRPGNYVFYDAIQVGLGVVSPDKCSLRVVASVIGHPAPDRVIIDAGSKVFALDKGAHGTNIVDGFGIIVNHPNASLARLSEEHGIIDWPADEPISLGDRLEIIPNHACTVINLTDEVLFVHEDDTVEVVPVAARGKVK